MVEVPPGSRAEVPPACDVPASERDRAEAASHVRHAHDAGHVSLDELHARLDAIYRARTLGELTTVTCDCPAAAAALQPGPPPKRHRLQLWIWLAGSLALVAAWLGSCVAAREVLPFWPVVPIGVWSAFLVAGWLVGVRDDGDPGAGVVAG